MLSAPEFQFFYELYITHNTRLIHYATRATGSKEIAEDLAADTFTFILENFTKVYKHPNPGGYITNVLKNKIYCEMKKARYTCEVPLSETVLNTYAHPNKPSLRASLPDDLSETDKKIIVMYFEQQLTSREIAHTLNMNHNTCRVRISRLLEKLRRIWGENPDEPIPKKKKNGLTEYHGPA